MGVCLCLSIHQVPLVTAALERLRFDEAGSAVLAISGRGNQFMEEVAPWTAFKKASRCCLETHAGLAKRELPSHLHPDLSHSSSSRGACYALKRRECNGS
jgi:methionyl-tRNA synthetase